MGGKHVHYPAICVKQRIQGRVIVSFAVNKDGAISDVETIQSPHPLLSKEAERVVKIMPKWVPAMFDGKPVRSSYNLPITFTLGGSNRYEFH